MDSEDIDRVALATSIGLLDALIDGAAAALPGINAAHFATDLRALGYGAAHAMADLELIGRTRRRQAA